MTQATAPTLVHSIDFPDGDHAVITTTAPGHFTITGQLGGVKIAAHLTAWRAEVGTRIDGMPDLIHALPADRHRAVVLPLWRYLATAELGTTRPAPLEDEQPESVQDTPAPIASHHVAAVDLGARGTADVMICEAGMIDIDMPTRNGLGYTIGSDPVSMAHTADQLEAGDSQGLGELTPTAMTALATALRAGIRAEAEYHPPLTTHENLRFEDGSHVIVHTSPGRVQVTGMIDGEYIEYAGTARDAQEQARLLETGAPDALWNLPAEQAHRIATAMSGAVDIAQPARRTACPSWCDDREVEGHWKACNGLWETLHARRFGPVTVYLPHEIHDDGLRWYGQSEVVLRHEDHQQQMDGESSLTVAESSSLATHLRDAARFGVKLDQHLAAQAVQGVVSLDPSVQGEQVAGR